MNIAINTIPPWIRYNAAFPQPEYDIENQTDATTNINPTTTLIKLFNAPIVFTINL